MDSVFKDNVVIITGASLGIGHDLALQLAEQGAKLVLAARDGERLTQVAMQCRECGASVIAVPTDVSESAQCQQLIDETVKAYGRIDTLINNAGVGMWSRFEDVQDITVFERLMRVNYLGSVYCTYYALPHVKQTRGRIVVVSSLSGKMGVHLRSGYAASKHAQTGLFDSLRIELAGSGVSVTVAYPDFVATGGRARNLDKEGKPAGHVPPYGKHTMSSQECARIIIDAAAKRKRDVIMTTRGKIGQWARLVVPGLVDRITRRASEKGE